MLLVTHKDRKDVNLFFDKMGLPIKSEVHLTDPAGKEVTIAYQYSDYKDFDGVKLCSKIAFKLDDKDFTIELSEIKALDSVDGGQFERP